MLIKTRNRTLAVNHATFQHSVVIIFAELLCSSSSSSSSSSSIYWYETYLHVYNHNNNIITNYNMITNNK